MLQFRDLDLWRDRVRSNMLSKPRDTLTRNTVMTAVMASATKDCAPATKSGPPMAPAASTTTCAAAPGNGENAATQKGQCGSGPEFCGDETVCQMGACQIVRETQDAEKPCTNRIGEIQSDGCAGCEEHGF